MKRRNHLIRTLKLNGWLQPFYLCHKLFSSLVLESTPFQIEKTRKHTQVIKRGGKKNLSTIISQYVTEWPSHEFLNFFIQSWSILVALYIYVFRSCLLSSTHFLQFNSTREISWYIHDTLIISSVPINCSWIHRRWGSFSSRPCHQWASWSPSTKRVFGR